MARAVRKPPSTVQSWRDTGRIPAWHQQTVMTAARRAGIDLVPDDFFKRG